MSLKLIWVLVNLLFCFATGSKRLVLHDDADLRQAVQTLAEKVHNLENTIATLQTQTGTSGGSIYVRWGRNSCPANGTNLVYTGLAGGSFYGHSGGATNLLCLTTDPQFDYYEDAHNSGAKVYGVEYQFGQYHGNDGASFFKGKHLYEEDVPCSVCHSVRSMVMMVPGRMQCYPGWTKEYSGYLVAESEVHNSSSEYLCLDSDPDVLMGGHSNDDGRLFYLVEAVCGSLKCPPYVDGREITCVVCTK